MEQCAVIDQRTLYIRLQTTIEMKIFFFADFLQALDGRKYIRIHNEFTNTYIYECTLPRRKWKGERESVCVSLILRRANFIYCSIYFATLLVDTTLAASCAIIMLLCWYLFGHTASTAHIYTHNATCIFLAGG